MFICLGQLINSCEEVTNVNKLNNPHFNTEVRVCLQRIKYLTRLSEYHPRFEFSGAVDIKGSITKEIELFRTDREATFRLILINHEL